MSPKPPTRASDPETLAKIAKAEARRVERAEREAALAGRVIHASSHYGTHVRTDAPQVLRHPKRRRRHTEE